LNEQTFIHKFMPRTAEQFETMRETSRETLVQAALELFARYGFEKTSVRMIAEKAGVSLGLLYNYFESKEALLVTIFERGMQDVLKSFQVADTGTTPEQQLERLIRSSFEILHEHKTFWQVFYSLRSQPGIAEILPKEMLEWHWRIHKQLEQYLTQLKFPNPKAGAWLLFGAIDGVAQHWALQKNYPLGPVLEAMIEAFVSSKKQRKKA
jgi:AcrR family transcriptional regulator